MSDIYTFEICNTTIEEHLYGYIMLILESDTEGHAILYLPDGTIPPHVSTMKIVSNIENVWKLEEGIFHSRVSNGDDQAWYFEFVDYTNTGGTHDYRTQRYIDNDYKYYIQYNLYNPHIAGQGNGSGTAGGD